MSMAASLPPVVYRSWTMRLRSTYFGSPLNALITLACIVVVASIALPLLNWAIVDATWSGTADACRARGGACWAFIREKFWFSVFGLYPYEERWRPALMMIIFAVTVGVSLMRRFWRRELIVAWLVLLPVMGWLMLGGAFGLALVPTRLWGGWPVTIWLAVLGLAAAYPIAVLLALGRRSRLPILRVFSILWIEVIRGVPLITILFMSAIIVPLFMPEGMTIDRLVRAQIGFVMFASAYLAEVIRGGLQSIPNGQYEAADSLGLGFWTKTRLIILPQALKVTIPSQVNTFIGFFKDTTLVLVIGIFDFFTTLRAALADPNWLGFGTEAYVFAAVVYFLCCFGMSRYSQRLERDLSPETRR